MDRHAFAARHTFAACVLQLITILWLGTLAPPASAALVTHDQAISHKLTYLSQWSEAQSCEGTGRACLYRTAHVGNALAVGDLLRVGIGARELPPAELSAIAVLPRKTQWLGTSEAELVAEFDQHVRTTIGTVGRSYAAWLARYSIATGHADFIQRIDHRGKKKRLVMSLLITVRFTGRAPILSLTPPTNPRSFFMRRPIRQARRAWRAPTLHHWPVVCILRLAICTLHRRACWGESRSVTAWRVPGKH
jgi:hypothetical protein